MKKPTQQGTPLQRMVGAKIESIRVALGWTQSDLAKKVGLTRVSINNIENARHGHLRMDQIEKFAEAFGTSPKQLLKGIWF